MSDRTWAEVARAYDRTLPHWSAYRELIAEVTRAVSGASMVLDAGCGSGIVAEHLAALGMFVEGIDASPEMIELAAKRALRFPRRLAVSVQDATVLRFPAGSFDGVISTNVFFAVADPDAYLAELGRVLARGGRLAITGPTPRAARHVELLAEEMQAELEQQGQAAALRQELDVVTAVNRRMAARGFGRTCTAAEMSALLARTGLRIDAQHERLYRTALFFVQATKP